MPNPTVFISYSHKDEEWKDRLVTHLRVLELAGMLNVWDDRRIEAGDEWYPAIQEAMAAASVAVLLVSANFLTSKFIIGEEVPRLLQRREREGVKIFPVIVKPCAWRQVKWLSPIQGRPKDGRPLSGGSDYQIDSDLAAVAEEIATILRRVQTSEVSKTSEVSEGWTIAPEKISTAKLPSTSPDLFGREKELEALDAAWSPHPNPPPSSTGEGKTNVLSLVAFGGVGKTALVGKWLSRIARENYRGAERVFGWSFYSQGAAEGRQVSADPFIAAALGWFGDPDPARGSPWDKGERLAELIKRQRTLLILDGLEPLQNPPPVEMGRIKDPGLTALLRELARDNPGLVVVTTRLAVDDLKDFVGSSVAEIDLDNLSPDSGAAYLAHLGVKGTTGELEQAAADFGGHALALTLLGSYLTVAHGGEVRQRDKIAHLTDEKRQGAHARRVMESYERWLAGKPELDILRLMGLFDRPAERGAVEALRKKPPLQHLTSNLQRLSETDWQYAVESLRSLRLLSQTSEVSETSEVWNALDCHPLLREHFGEKLRASDPDAWREAHARLYEYYKAAAKELPDTIEEMAPLFAAVAHGCLAGRHQEALDEVYWRRIQRGKESFNTKKLGALGSELAALSGFFDPPWRKPVEGLTEGNKGFVLNAAGFHLRALGRLAEAAGPMQAALNTTIAQKDWKNAARYASNLSELFLTLGDVPSALDTARQSVELADRSGEAFERMALRTTLADALHQAGRLAEAGGAFREAEEIQKKDQPQFPLLYSVQGFQYCDLLLSQGEYAEVQRRAGQALKWVELARQDILSAALDHLSLGRAGLLAAESDLTPAPLLKGEGKYAHAAAHLDRAVDGLRQAGTQHHIPSALLARAELRRVTGEFERARHDLDEAFAIATRGGMRLHQADSHLEYARLYLALGEKEAARESLAKAKKLIEATGYRRREGEVRELEGRVNE